MTVDRDVEGRLEMEIDGRVVVPAVGEEVLIPARARHSVPNTGGTTARWLYGYGPARKTP
jgi:cupin 2 domain-containing protein